jgi:hypothetical protein
MEKVKNHKITKFCEKWQNSSTRKFDLMKLEKQGKTIGNNRKITS